MKMRWPLLTLGLVGAGALLMAPGPRRGQPGANPNPRAPALEVLRSGSGMSHVQPLCETALAMGLLTGDFAYCFDGAGNNYEDGGTRMAVTSGFMHSLTNQVCPSGPNCNTSRTGRAALDAGIGIARVGGTTVDMGGNQDFSCGWFGEIKRDDAVPDIAGRGTGTPQGTVSSRMWMTSSGTPSAIILYTDGGFSAIGAATAATTPGPALIVQTYDFVAEGSSLHKLYTNGYADGQSTTASGNLRAATSRWIGANGGDWGDMTVYGQFCTSTVLTLAQVQALDSAVRGKLTGSRGEAITTTRNSNMFCTNEDQSAGTTLAANQPCVRKGGLVSEPAGTNLLTKSEEIEAWTLSASSGSVTATANAAIAPDGTLTAESVSYPTVSGGSSYAFALRNATLSVAPHTFSVWLKSPTGSNNSLWLFAYNASTGADGQSTPVTITPTWQRFSLTFTPATGVSYSFGVGAARLWSVGGDVVAQTNLIWGAQVETGSYPTSYIRTEGSTATRVASYHTVSSTLADIPVGANTAYCMGATWVPPVGATAWSHTANGVPLVAIGSSYRSANEAFLYVGSTGLLNLDTTDNSSAQKRIASTGALSFALHRVVACNNAGTVSMFVDGAAVPSSVVGGAGTGLLTTMPSTHDIGSLNSAEPTYQSRGVVKDICIGPIGSCQ